MQSSCNNVAHSRQLLAHKHTLVSALDSPACRHESSRDRYAKTTLDTTAHALGRLPVCQSQHTHSICVHTLTGGDTEGQGLISLYAQDSDENKHSNTPCGRGSCNLTASFTIHKPEFTVLLLLVNAPASQCWHCPARRDSQQLARRWSHASRTS